MKYKKILFWIVGFIAIALSFHNWENNYHIDYYNDRYLENHFCITNPLHNCDLDLLDGFDKYFTNNITEGYNLYIEDSILTWRRHLRNIFIGITLAFLIVSISIKLSYIIWREK